MENKTVNDLQLNKTGSNPFHLNLNNSLKEFSLDNNKTIPLEDFSYMNSNILTNTNINNTFVVNEIFEQKEYQLKETIVFSNAL
ncbi:hypothetical protein [Chryseobacterium sp.]|uniref:hypothetical protein n=1 Tax=Chryseobacterium sp. TaxID=1871047 RepID=UPI000ED915B3|nr:hypothetical protein [Chryseobacterium sp.]HCA06931.1 hypothetical protein [Chryseobacterium sp.]